MPLVVPVERLPEGSAGPVDRCCRPLRAAPGAERLRPNIPAGATVDDLLSHLGYEGETIAERLKIVDPTQLKSIDRVWSAHRLRNAIAHEPLQQYTREMIMHALDSYQLAFQELGFLKAESTLDGEEKVLSASVIPAEAGIQSSHEDGGSGSLGFGEDDKEELSSQNSN